MDLVLKVTAKSASKSAVGQRDTNKVNALMRAFWKTNPVVYKVGRFLAEEHEGMTLAAHLAAGREFKNLPAIMAENGRVLPLQEGFTLSLKTLDIWGCPACESAHGSGVGQSGKVNVAALESCKFYYSPSTKKFFTISTTCWGKYVKALGYANDRVFAQVPEPEPEPATPANKGGVKK
jgi:hypothetical protein